MNRRPSAPIDEAAEWLATLSDPACTTEERKAFAQWLRRSNVNVEEFLTISTLTRRLETSSAWPQFDLDQVLAEAKGDHGKVALFPHVPRGQTRMRTSSKLTLAAAVALALLAPFLMLDQLDGLRDSRYSTGLGELRSVTLEDGSIVEIDAQSAIRERYTAKERTVELLSGTAIFKVAKNPARPFRVSTGLADIVAVGTAFNVSAGQDRTVVTVLEGRVRVHEGLSNHRTLEIKAGEQVVAEPHKPLARTPDVDPLKITAWTARRLYFEDTPLAEAVQAFSRYSAQTIRIEDAQLAQKRITGTFDAIDPGALVTFLKRYADTAVDDTPDGWVVRAAP